MPRLIVLNGPPGIGKSTLGKRYVADHPQVRRLDIDELAQSFDGWREIRAEVMPRARTRALEIIEGDLSRGYDVLVPQYVGVLSELARFEGVAAVRNAAFVHVVLMAPATEAAKRFDDRGRTATTEWLSLVHAEKGLSELAAFETLVERLANLVRARPMSLLIDSRTGAIDETYARLCTALDGDVGTAPS